MLWTIYMIWILFIVVIGVIDHFTDKDFGIFILILSAIVMFYVPFMIWMFQNKNLTFLLKYDIINYRKWKEK